MRRNQLIALGCVIILLIVAIILPTLLRKPTSSTHPTEAAQHGLTITNIGYYSAQFDANVVPQMQQALFDHVKSSVQRPALSYDATVRPNSFAVQHNPYEGTDPPMDVPTVTFLVDIPAAKQTYSVSYSGGTNYPYKILHVTCPPTGQSKYPTFECKDKEQ